MACDAHHIYSIRMTFFAVVGGVVGVVVFDAVVVVAAIAVVDVSNVFSQHALLFFLLCILDD